MEVLHYNPVSALWDIVRTRDVLLYQEHASFVSLFLPLDTVKMVEADMAELIHN